MVRRPRSLITPARNGQPRTFKGRGQVLSPGISPAPVRYEVVVEERWGQVSFRGTLQGRHALLWPMWLEPVVVLRLSNGQRLEISISDLVGNAATFELAEPVSDPPVPPKS